MLTDWVCNCGILLFLTIFQDMFSKCNPELAADDEWKKMMSSSAVLPFSVLSKSRYKARFQNEKFLKKSSLLTRFPSLTLVDFLAHGLDCSNFLTKTERRRVKILLKDFGEPAFRFVIFFFDFLVYKYL
jgi:hypothetical protein